MKKFFILSFLLCCQFVLCGAADFDVAVIGTGPISMFEALYQHHCGKKVIIFEEDSRCGGAWKSIDICGVPHADMGCHFMGGDIQLHQFLVQYAGCNMVSLDEPGMPYTAQNSPNGFYPSRGCFELIDNLEKLIRSAEIVLHLSCPVESIWFDPDQPIAYLRTKIGEISVDKVIHTPFTGMVVEQAGHSTPIVQNRSKSTYYHLYLLIEDPTPSRFSYRNISINGSSRVMNLSRFVGIEDSGKKLIIFQIYKNADLNEADLFLNQLKSEGLIDTSATLLQAETYNYEQFYFNGSFLYQNNEAQKVFEMLSTGAFSSMSGYIHKWKQVLPTFESVAGLNQR